MTKDTVNKVNPPLLMPKPSKSVVIPPKKPARTKLAGSTVNSVVSISTESKQRKKSGSTKNSSSAIIDVAIADEDTEDESESAAIKKVISLKKEYKMIRLIKEGNQNNELGIIIAKKKLPDLQPPVTGFQVVHIEPRGLIDR